MTPTPSRSAPACGRERIVGTAALTTVISSMSISAVAAMTAVTAIAGSPPVYYWQRSAR